MTNVDLADEDAKFMQYLAENGWEGEIGEDDGKSLVADGGSEVGTFPSKKESLGS
jgi:hypothetical protein